MAKFDNILFWLFLSVIIISLSWSAFAFYRAFKNADYRKDPDGFKMFIWSVAGLAGLIIAGMSAAYILLPIIFHYTE
ncbi:MAG: hypothetical protein HZB59_04060 [Ignavibacteriales bacterium]|nr:hypothetical protein [Ignavibacteriales bacterium]